MNTVIVLMAKNPVPGQVKTRLATVFGHKKATAIYKYLLRKTVLTMAKTDTAACIIYHSPEIYSDEEWMPAGIQHKIQTGGDLGQRMAGIFNEELNFFQKVILIGADCATLQVSQLNDAIKRLDYTDVVLGPSEDGGYYLIGLKAKHTRLFEDMEWSTENVFTQTVDRLEEQRLSLALLEYLYDIDYAEDWNRWKHENEA